MSSAGNADLVRMVALMDADYTRLEKQMKKGSSVFAQQCTAIEARESNLRKRLTAGAAKFTGLSSLGGALAGLTAVGIGAGLVDMTMKSLDAAKAIGELAEQAGISPERLQMLRYAASQTGSSFETMDTALVYFNKTFGEFLNSGAGRGAQAFKTLGLDKAINSGQVKDAAQAFDFVITKIRSFGNESQRAGFAANVFGKEAGPKMAGFINAGAAAITELENKARSLGIVLSDDTVRGATEASRKLSTLFQVMEAEGVAAVAHLAPQIAELAQKITDGLPDLVLWGERWAEWFGLIRLSPLDKLKGDIADIQNEIAGLQDKKDNNGGWWKSLFGVSNSDLDALIGASKDKLSAAHAKLAEANSRDYAPGGVPAHFDGASFLAQYGTKPAPHINDIAGAKEAEALAEKRKEMLDKIGVDQATADLALVAEQNKLNVQLLQGQSGYYDAVKKQIADDLAAKITQINAEEKKELDSLEKLKLGRADYAAFKARIEATAAAKTKTAQTEAASQSDEAGSGSLLRQSNIAADKQIQGYKDAVANLGLLDGALAAATFYQNALNTAREKGLTLTPEELAALKQQAVAVGQQAQAAADAQKVMQRSISVQDDTRSGLEDIGAAGVKGFKSMKDAAAQFLEQLAEMIIKLYVMKPLVEGLLGAAGGNGGGLIGSLLGSALGSPSADAAKTGIATVTEGPAGASLMAAGTTLNSAAYALIEAAATLSGGSVGGGLSGLSGLLGGGGGDPLGLGGDGGDFTGGIGGLFGARDGGVFVPGKGMANLKRFRSGGVSNKAAIFGEAGAEAAVPLPDGRSIPVAFKMPSLSSVRGMNRQVSSPVTISVDARGAQIGVAEQIDAKLRAAGPVIAASAVKASRAEFPQNMYKHMRDTF